MERKTPLARCEECPLLMRVGMGGRGKVDDNGHADIVIVGEGPGREEAVQKKVFVGPSGRMLMSAFDPNAVSSYWITNSSLCFTSDVKEKMPSALCCKERLLHELASLTPKIIVTMGNIPTEIVLGKGEGITKRRGRFVEAVVDGHKTTVLPTVHPAAVLRTASLGPDFKADFAKAVQFVQPAQDVHVSAPSPYSIPFTVTQDFKHVIREAEEGQFAVFDIETSSLDMTQGRIVCAVIATHKGIYIIPEEIVERPDFALAMEQSTANWSAHEAKFDRNFFLYRTGRRVRIKFDSLLGHYLFDERLGIHGLKEICAREYGAPDWEEIVHQYTRKMTVVSYADVPREELYVYAANDGYWQYHLTEDLVKRMGSEPKFCWLMKHLLAPAVNALSDAETRGVLLDQDKLQLLYPKYAQAIAEQESLLYQIAGHKFNPRSTQQVAKIMYDELGISEVGSEGRSTAAKTVLRAIDDHPFVDALLNYRELYTILTRYVKGLSETVARDGRIHTTFNLAGTVTGRLSSKTPNLQNQPSRKPEFAKDIRDLFLADSGLLWSDADMSQIEYRLIALFSQDSYLLSCYREGRDLHAEMARDVWGPGFTKANRTAAKTLNFGIAYGRSVEGIMRDATVVINREQAEEIARLFFERAPGVVAFNEQTKRTVLAQGFVESPLGRRRRFPQLPFVRDNRAQLNEIFREAINMVTQSAASDATLYSLVTLHQKGYQPMLTVHDSITLLADEHDIEDTVREQMRIMQACAEELYGNSIPLPAEGAYGKRWGSLTEVKK